MAGRKGGSKSTRRDGGTPSRHGKSNERAKAASPKGRPSRPAVAPPKHARKPESARKPEAAPKAQRPAPPPVIVPPPPRPKRRQPAPEGPNRAGFAVLIGRPNVGKSTLLNRLVGEHLAIVSPRPQTTRNRILGVITEPGTQLCLIDVPGVHKAKGLLNRSMVHAALSAMTEVDVVLVLAEAGWPQDAPPGDPNVDVVGPFHRDLLNDVKKSGKPAILVLTKIDLVPKHLLLPIMESWGRAFEWKEVFPLSGLTGENTDRFSRVVRKYLPESGPLFAPDMITDQPERALAAEFIREQVFLQTHDEIPYGVAISVDEFDESERPGVESDDLSQMHALAAEPESINESVAELDAADDEDEFEDDVFEEDDDLDSEEEPEAMPATPSAPELKAGLVRIEASIIVDRETHKGIVIGRRGERIRQIGTAARMHIERLLGTRVWLGLHVRVIPGWTEKKSYLAEFGYLGQ